MTGNPGCILQFRCGLKEAGLPVKVLHPVELLAKSYENGPRPQAPGTAKVAAGPSPKEES